MRKLNLTSRSVSQDLEDMLDAGIHIEPLSQDEVDVAADKAKKILKSLRTPKKLKKINIIKLTKKLRNRCRKIWREKVLARWGSACVVCGATKLPNCHHIVPKEMFGILRYDPINSIVLCPRHHKYGKFSAHKNPLWFVDILIAKMKPDDIEYLKKTMNDPTVVIYNVEEYRKVLDKLNGDNNV